MKNFTTALKQSLSEMNMDTHSYNQRLGKRSEALKNTLYLDDSKEELINYQAARIEAMTNHIKELTFKIQQHERIQKL